MKKYICFFLFLIVIVGTAFTQNKTERQKKLINNQLILLDNFNASYQTDSDESVIPDPDSLSSIIADNIMLYLAEVGFDKFDPTDFLNLEVSKAIHDENISVIRFAYNSGGTAGMIPTSIIIKANGAGYKYYNMEQYEADFYDFYPLSDNLYLCLATVPGWGMCANNGVYAFYLGNEAIPATVFDTKSSFHICNSDISFDTKTNILSVDVDHVPFYDGGDDSQQYFNHIGLGFFDVVAYDTTNEDFQGLLTTWFDGKRFVKPIKK